VNAANQHSSFLFYINCICVIEAARAIIVYTGNPAELLRRKKIRREVLFQYAHDEKIYVMPTDEKMVIVRHIMAHWGSQDVSDDYLAVRKCSIILC
jgi:hypothetical protein